METFSGQLETRQGCPAAVDWCARASALPFPTSRTQARWPPGARVLGEEDVGRVQPRPSHGAGALAQRHAGCAVPTCSRRGRQAPTPASGRFLGSVCQLTRVPIPRWKPPVLSSRLASPEPVSAPSTLTLSLRLSSVSLLSHPPCPRLPSSTFGF